MKTKNAGANKAPAYKEKLKQKLNMANADIRQLEMDGSVFYPQTDINGLVNNGEFAIDDEPIAESDNLVKSGGIDQLVNYEIEFSLKNSALLNEGSAAENNPQFDVTDYIHVNEGDVFEILCYTGLSTTWATVCGYSADFYSSFVEILVPGFNATTNRVEFTIPQGINYIRCSGANSNHPSYRSRYLGKRISSVSRILDNEYISSNFKEDITSNIGNNILPIDCRLDKNSIFAPSDGSANWYFFRSTGEVNNGRVIVRPTEGYYFSGIRLNQVGFISTDKPLYYSFKFKSNSEYRMMFTVGTMSDSPRNYQLFVGGNNEEKTITGRIDVNILGITLDRLQISYYDNTAAYSYPEFEIWDLYLWQDENSVHSQLGELKSSTSDTDGKIEKLINENTTDLTRLIVNSGYLNASGGVGSNSSFSYSDFIIVEPGKEVNYNAWPGNDQISCIQGFNNNKEFQCSLLTGVVNCLYINKKITIPFGIFFIRICTTNSTHSNYYTGTSVSIKNVNGSSYKELLISDAMGGIFWTIDNSIKVGNYYIFGVSSDLTVKLSTTQNVSQVFKTITTEKLFDGIYKFEVTEEDINLGGKYLRLTTSNNKVPKLAYYIEEDTTSIVNNIINFSPLHNKNVVILGDSISTSGNYVKTDPNTAEITIQPEDVGVTLSAYVTNEDVAGGLSLGGTTFTTDNIGQEVTFVPTSNDIGKSIGVPLNYNNAHLKVWWKWMKEEFSCNIIPVCWSGSGLTRNRTTNNAYKASYSWHESQIRKCGIRIPGTMQRTSPDVIIITRGGNDFTHPPYAMLTDNYFDNYNVQYPDIDIREDGKYGFKEAYFMTIGKLREAYPSTKIILCTYTPFLRGNVSHFPPNNGSYSEPQYNNAVREIANFCGCDLIEFDKCGITFENIYPTYAEDSSTNPVHPNYKGHELMGKYAINALKNMDFTK